MLTLSRVFRRLTVAGRREASAAKWDRTADRMAKRKHEASQLCQFAIAWDASQELIDDLYMDVQQFEQAEHNARTVAAEIRAGR